MPRALASLVLLAALLGAGCDAATTDPSTTDPSPPTTTEVLSPTQSVGRPTPSAPPTTNTVGIVELPPGIPPRFEGDVAAANVPAAALVPLKTEVTGTWYGVASNGEAIVVAWQVPGRDPLRLARGYAVWRRFADGWAPIHAELLPRSAGVLGISGTPTEVTGDGSDDVILRLDTGGSGSCARTIVLELATGAEAYDEEGCDRAVEPHAGPTGLLVTEAVFEPGDPHCCPSAFRESVLTYVGDGAWDVASETTRPA